MKNIPLPFKNSTMSKITFIFSWITLVFWIIAKTTDVYAYAITGAIFEILWLPMLASLFLLPIVGIVFWIKEKFNPHSFFLYSALITLITLVFAVLK